MRNISLKGLDNGSYPIDCVGWSISSDIQGRIVALTSFNEIKLFTPSQGQDFQSPTIYMQQINLDASRIFHSIFLPHQKGTSSQHLMLAVIYQSKQGDMKASIYSWWTESSISTISHYATTPLHRSIDTCYPLFAIPIFCDGGAFMLISQNPASKTVGVNIITVNDVVSATLERREIALPETPVSYFQDNDLIRYPQSSNDYAKIQKVYLATESNRILELIVEMGVNSFEVSNFLQLPNCIGSSLVMLPYDSHHNFISDTSIEIPDFLSIHTSGDGVTGGSYFFTNSEDGYQLQYYDKLQQWGPVHDGLAMDVVHSFSDTNYYKNKSEIYLASGSTPDSWALTHIRYGVRAMRKHTDLNLALDSKIFSTSRLRQDSPTADDFFLSSNFDGNRLFRIKKSSSINEGTSINSLDSDFLMEEILQSAPVDFANQTLAFASIDNLLVQVTTKNLVLTDLDETTLKIPFSNIERAHIFESYILIASSITPSSRIDIHLYRITPHHTTPLQDSLQLVGKTSVEKKPLTSFVSLWAIPASFDEESIHPYVFVSTVDGVAPNLKIFQIGKNTDLVEIQNITNGIDVPNDIISVPSDDDWCSAVLVGQRDGIFVYAEWNTQEFSIRSSYKIGDSIGVEFITDGSTIFAISGLIYKLDLTDFNSQFRPELVVLDKNDLVFPSSVCLFLASSTNNEDTVLAATFGEKLTLIEAAERPEYFTLPISLAGPPRQLLYLEHIELVAVIFNYAYEPVGFGKDNTILSQQSLIQFIDPKSGLTLDADRWKPTVNAPKRHEGTFGFFNSISGTDGVEKFYCMVEWTFQRGDDTYKYLVIGSECNKRGQIYLLDTRRKRSSPTVELRKRFSRAFDSAVYSVAQLDNNTIICVTATSVQLLRLELDINSDGGKSTYRLNPLVYSIDSPMRQVAVKNNFVYLLSASNSVQVYKYHSDHLTLLQAETRMRSCLSQTILDDNTLVVTDTSKSLVVFGSKTYIGAETSTTLESLLEVQFPTLIAKVLSINAPENPEITKLPFAAPNHGKPQALIALGINGAVYMLYLLDHDSYSIIKNRVDGLSGDAQQGLGSTAWKEQQKQRRVVDFDLISKRYPNERWVKNVMKFSPFNQYY